jgi:hypothetical protein
MDGCRDDGTRAMKYKKQKPKPFHKKHKKTKCTKWWRVSEDKEKGGKEEKNKQIKRRGQNKIKTRRGEERREEDRTGQE